mmetsp:Transcript_5645/g.18619  ORF Transcript_5645/g.18619 Transcript_5645/m.18619 type:complete len:414 (-) Transcript_5645:2889-4130(-)
MSPPVSDEGAFLLRRRPVPATSWFPEVRSILLGAVCACACVVEVTQLGQVVCFAPGGAGFHALLGQNPFGLTKELQPERVTLVAACALVDERIPAFQTAIQSWAAAATDSNAGKRSFDRVIVVDWSSDANLWQQVLNFWNVATPLDFYRVGDASGNKMDWVLSKAYNFGFEKVTTDVILKVDCDTFIARGLLVLNPIESTDGSKKVFRYGDYRAARDDNEIHINGCVMATKQTMKNVNYYDERLQQYGWDDTNFYDRLFASGATPMNITRVNGAGKTMITHVWHPHSDATQDERVVSSCQNRCAINHVERRNAWAGLPRSVFWKNDARFPGGYAPENKHISFENHRGGALPSVEEVLGAETAGLIETFCKNAEYASTKCHNGCDWSNGYIPREELAFDAEVKRATAQLQALGA